VRVCTELITFQIDGVIHKVKLAAQSKPQRGAPELRLTPLTFSHATLRTFY
jgi:hypothetical protein